MSDEAAKTTAAPPASTAPTRGRQLRVMLDKLWLVRKRSVGQNIQLYVIPIMSLIVMYLFYGAFQAGNNKWKSSGILVRERETKLRDVLAVMGCDFRAYWLGTFLGDSILLAIAWVLGYWIFVPATGISRYLNNAGMVLRAVDATASPLSPLRLGGHNVALGPLEGFPSPPLGGQTLALWSS